MLTAEQKRAQQQAESEKRQAEADENHKAWKAAQPAILKEQRRSAIVFLTDEIAKASGQEVVSTVWELRREIEASVVRHFTKAGYRLTLRYVSTPDSEWGSDGEMHANGKYLHGVNFTIRW